MFSLIWKNILMFSVSRQCVFEICTACWRRDRRNEKRSNSLAVIWM